MEKKIYELTVVMGDKKTEKDEKTLVEAALEKVGGRLVEFNFWGKKDLVRPIKKQGTVVMGFFEVELAAAKVAEFGTRLRMNDEVMRHLVVIKDQSTKIGKSTNKKIEKTVNEKPIINSKKK